MYPLESAKKLGQDYHIGTARKMSVGIDATPELLLLIKQKLHIVQFQSLQYAREQVITDVTVLLSCDSSETIVKPSLLTLFPRTLGHTAEQFPYLLSITVIH